MRALVVAVGLVVFVSCGGSGPPPAPEHTGWTVRYTLRTGSGTGLPDDVRPDVTLVVRDGRASLTVGTREARLDGTHRRANLCESAACRSVGYLDAVTATGIFGDWIWDARPAQTSHPSVETIDDRLLIADVPTHGMRLTDQIVRGGQTLRITLEVRWIDDPGDASVEVAKDVFLSALEHNGWMSLASEIRRSAGLPVAWLVRASQLAPDGSSSQERVASLRAAVLGNPPAVGVQVQ